MEVVVAHMFKAIKGFKELVELFAAGGVKGAFALVGAAEGGKVFDLRGEHGMSEKRVESGWPGV